ncbi:hypothetical protein NON00_17585 [Roseomonas sp. GC11]|uniref:PGPGW domain-containing protein n=1 Tax=Roseomonas sp. GC11 TaxID=2950546 RepID=UPI00210B46C1|nr:PGPGW domain-containing protein [Roseomonas sp. GC11]MCQ4161730.1 hypothetical protein [Roseomonas sp. GC11]
MLVFRPSWKRKLAGWSLLALGVVGVILPFLNGTIFLLLGLFVLREQHAWSQRCLGWCEARWPGPVGRLGEMEARLIQRCGEGAAWLRRRLGMA